jgi:hypothetical protein
MESAFAALIMLASKVNGTELFSQPIDGATTERTTKLLVEVSRHCQRASSVIYPFTVDEADNF